MLVHVLSFLLSFLFLSLIKTNVVLQLKATCETLNEVQTKLKDAEDKLTAEAGANVGSADSIDRLTSELDAIKSEHSQLLVKYPS